jgi:hypothetical protein
MTSNTSIFNNIESLPYELQYKIYEQFTLEELFALNRQQIPSLQSLSFYIDRYLENKKYKEQSRLKDCMFLINFEEYRDLIYEYLYDLVATIGIKFFEDVTRAGGPIHFMNLTQEENPRNIYTIKIQMKKDSFEYEYIITSVGGFPENNIVYYNFGFIGRTHNTRTMLFNENTIVDTLIDIIDIMKFDGRSINCIRYYREKYFPNFIRLKTPILYTTEGFHLGNLLI